MVRRPKSVLAPTLTRKDDADLIQLARKRFDQVVAAENNQRQRELEDLEFYAGKQWPQDVLNARDGTPGNATSGLPPVPARPSFTINKVREPVRYVLNQERQSELGVEIAAADDFGDLVPSNPAEIELREGLVRRIQRHSHAKDARSWAFTRACIAGRGFWRVMIRYVRGRTMDQDIYIDRIYNQASVSLDPTHEQPDGSDAEWGFIASDIPLEQYKRQFRKVKGANGSDYKNQIPALSRQDFRNLGDELPGWFTTGTGELRSVRVVEYWYIQHTSETIVELTTGEVVPKSAVEKGVDTIALDDDGNEISRDHDVKSVQFVKMDGVQVLERTDWPGQYLPIIKVVGEEISPYDSERRAEGMVRPARDSNRGVNVMISSIVEDIATSPKSPLMGPTGFDEGYENEYQLAATRNIPVLHFNALDANGKPIAGAVDPTPKRPPKINPSDIAAQVTTLQYLDQSVNATMAVPDPAFGDISPSLKSAEGIKEVLDQSALATSHYQDNLARSTDYEGTVVNDLLYAVFGKPGRMARLIGKDGTGSVVPMMTDVYRHPETGAVTKVNGSPPPPGVQPFQFTLTPGTNWNVAIKVTPSQETRRQSVENTLTTVIGGDPQFMQFFGDLLFKYSDVDGHQELEERAFFMLNPAVQQAVMAKKGQGPQQDPQQVIQQLQAKLAQVAPLADKNQTTMAVAQLKAQTDLEGDRINAQTQITAAEIKAGNEDLKAQIQVLATLINTVKEERLAEKQHASDALATLHGAAHDVGMAAMDHAHETQQAVTGAVLAPPPPPVDTSAPGGAP